MRTTLALTGIELRLMAREWTPMVFAFAFPILLMLILAGVFGTAPAAEYGGIRPDDYYVADYVVVPMAALTLIGLPVLLAGYRERGVLRRFAAASVPLPAVLGAQAAVTALLALGGSLAVLAAAAPVYGVPAVQDPARTGLGLLLGLLVMTGLGLCLGMLMHTARSAQAMGLLLFFPMWLLGAGGPPRAVLPDAMATIADLLPLGRTADAVREPWLGTGASGDDLLTLVAWLLAVVLVGALIRRIQSRPNRSRV